MDPNLNTPEPIQVTPPISSQEHDVQTSPPPADETKQSRKFNFTYILIALLILIIIVLFGVVFMSQNKTATPAPTPTPADMTGSALVSPAEPKATSSADTTDWKTFTNPKYGITFKAPPSYKISEESDHLAIGDIIVVTLTVGKDKYFGCSVPVDKCPKRTGVIINNTTAFKNTGTENSPGFKDLLEYEFPGINPNTTEVSTDTEYHLFFDYVGDPNDKSSMVTFDNIVNTVVYKYGRVNEASGR